MVEEIRVEGDSRNVVHKNYVLVRAASPENAYERAQELGKNSESSYDNPEGKLVQIRFRGLSQLNVVYDDLDHGAEIYYEELCNLSEEQLNALVRSKEDLAVFQPVLRSTGPDYSSRDVVEEAKRLIRGG